MLSFSRNTDYALISLAHLAGRAGGVTAAREIGETYSLSISLVMKMLKRLQHKGIVRSVRGVKGGYQLDVDLHSVSLYDLIETVKQMDASESGRVFREVARASLPTEPPLLAVHSKLMRFLKDVMLSDLVLPGRRIDVPSEMVRRMVDRRIEQTNPNNSVAAVAA